MNIAAITACTIGVAHTYIAKEKLIEAAQNRGHSISVETQETSASKMNCHRMLSGLRMP